jgi:DNA/RNA endonuclease YhcR with UshA esterase domain
VFQFKGRIVNVLLAVTMVLPVPIAFTVGKTPVAYAEGPSDPAPVLNPVGVPNGKKVLFDNTHGQTAGAADWVIDGGFSDFGNGLASKGYYVKELRKTTPITLADLEQYDAFVIGEANIPYKTSEQAAMIQYVQNGGSIFFIADHYNADRNKNRWDASEVMNGYRRGAWDNPAKGMTTEEAASSAMQGVQSSDWLSDNFGVRFRYNALADIVSGQNIVPPDQSFGITAGVANVAMHAGSTLAITDPTKAKGLVYLPQTNAKWANAVDQGVYHGGGIAEGPYSAIAKVGGGKAAFIGDSSPVEDATPKYLREENGQTKTTYAGWFEEQDATYLLNIIDWLTTKELSITSLDQYPGLTLDQPTQLLNFEEPSASTEPQAEPWAAPAAGYKWYDPTTFKPGSYGSAVTVSNPVYSFTVQSTLPSNEQEFPLRVVINNLAPFATLSNLNIGLYNPSGGAQLGMVSIDGAAYPATPGYSASFSVTADAKGHAVKEVKVKIKGTPASANVRIRNGSTALLTKTVPASATELPQALPPDIAPVSTIVMARSKTVGTTVSMEGVVTTNPGAFGGQSFYLQDETGGMYIYQNTPGFSLGVKVLVSGDLTLYNGELELASINYIGKTGTGTLPAPQVVTGIDAYNQGQLLQLDQVKIENLTDATPSGSFEFDAVAADSTKTHVRIDARTGLVKTAFQQAYSVGDTIKVTGIASIINSTYLLKPRGAEDFALISHSNTGGTTGGNTGAIQPVLIDLEVEAAQPSIQRGQTVQLAVYGVLSDSTRQDVTAQSTFEAFNGMLLGASVNSSGLVTTSLNPAVKLSQLPINVTHGSHNKQYLVNVTDPAALAVVGLELSKTTETVSVGDTFVLPTVYEKLSDGTRGNVVTMAWNLDNMSLAQFGLTNKAKTPGVITFTTTSQSYTNVNFVLTINARLNTPPVTSVSFAGTLGHNGWYQNDVTMTFQTIDAEGDAITRYWKPAQSTNPFAPVTGNTPFGIEGDWSIAYYSNDGYEDEAVKTIPLKIDKSAPITASSIANPIAGAPWTYEGSVDIVLTSTDHISGVDKIYYSIDASSQVGVASGSTVTLGTVGTHTITFYGVDNAGNKGTDSTFQVTILETPSMHLASPSTIIRQGSTTAATLSAQYSNNSIDVSLHSSWVSSNPNIATVSNGVITGISIGSSVITATYGGYPSQTLTVNVITKDDASPAAVPTLPAVPAPVATTPPADAEKPAEHVDIFKSEAVKTDGNVVQHIEAMLKVSQPTSNASIAEDTKGHWSEKTVNTFVKLGVIDGYGDGKFNPNGEMTRAEFATIIDRVFNINKENRQAPILNDISQHWAKETIEKLAASGVLNGYGDEFRPDKTITRAEMIAIMSRVIKMDAVKKTSIAGSFTDINSSFAADAIKDAANAGIIQGKAEDKFDPESPTTRAESLTVIMNTLNLHPQIKSLLDALS